MKLLTHWARVAALAAPLMLALSCSKPSDAGPKSRPAPLVVVAAVVAKDVAIEVRAPIELRPLEQADIGSKALGVLDAVLVDRGDRVKKGQLLALVRPSELPSQLAAAQGSLAQTDAQMALARTNFERALKLAPQGIVSQQELSNAKGALAQAEAMRSAAQAQVGAIATRIGETRIESPMEGQVSARRLDPGALVSAATPILTIVRIDTLRVFITVTERDVRSVKIGQNARIELDAIPGQPLLGKVVRVAPALDPITRTLEAEVQLPNPGEGLKPGMFGRGAIVVDVHPKAPIVPASAMQISDGKRYVFVVSSGEKAGEKTEKVERRLIETGHDEGAWLEVTSGLKVGDEIVTAGTDGLSDGAAIRSSRGTDPYTGKSASPQASAPSSSPSSPSAN